MVDLAALIGERCPGIDPESVAPLGEGDFFTVYLVNDEWVFRVAKHDDAEASLRREVCLLPRIAGQFTVAVPVPEVVSLRPTPAFAVHRVLRGPELTRDGYLALAERDRERCAQRVGTFLSQLHSTDLAVARSCGLVTMDFAARAAELLARARTHALGHLSATDRAFVQARLTPSPSVERRAFEPAVLHGDLSPDHVIYDPLEVTVSAIIDFSDLAIGDPAWDFVYIYEDYGLDFLRRALRAYKPAEPRSFLRRLFDWYELDLIDWAVDCAAHRKADLDHAVQALSSLRIDETPRLDSLRRACLG